VVTADTCGTLVSDRSGPEHRPLLVVGIPRSGTTWTMQVLETDPSVRTVLEPDNEGISAPAIWGKHSAGRFPALRPGDSNDDYRELWAWALVGAPVGARLRLAAQVMRAVQPPTRTRYLQGRHVPLMALAGAIARHPGRHQDAAGTTQRVLVKSVHAPLAVEWLAEQFDIDVLVILRHPGNVLASWLNLSLNERFVNLLEIPGVRSLLERWKVDPPGPDPVEQMIFQIGVLTTGLEEAAGRHPEWRVRTHEDLCRNPDREFRALFDEFGLSWSPPSSAYLEGHDRPGEGFVTRRVATDLPDGWTRQLSARQISQMREILSAFPLKTWTADDYRTADTG
jgi:hypothetical protein